MLTITSRDKPIGRAKVSALFFERKRRDDAAAEARRQVAARYGIHEKSIYQWQSRHPDCDWPLEQIAQQIVANKDQSAVAKRQGFTMKNGRHSFGRMA